MSAIIPPCDDGAEAIRATLREHIDPSLDLSVDRDGWHTVLGDATQEQVDAVIAEHHPDATDPVAAFRAALDEASTLDEMKAALKGGNGSPGAEARKGRGPT